jgi:hypothetical protein
VKSRIFVMHKGISQWINAIMLIGYARFCSIEQDTPAQVAALKTAGCELIFREKASATYRSSGN